MNCINRFSCISNHEQSFSSETLPYRIGHKTMTILDYGTTNINDFCQLYYFTVLVIT